MNLLVNGTYTIAFSAPGSKYQYLNLIEDNNGKVPFLDFYFSRATFWLIYYRVQNFL